MAGRNGKYENLVKSIGKEAADKVIAAEAHDKRKGDIVSAVNAYHNGTNVVLDNIVQAINNYLAAMPGVTYRVCIDPATQKTKK